MTVIDEVLRAPDPNGTGRYELRRATPADLLVVNEFRHQLSMADQNGGGLSAAPGRDEFDDRCDHLVVWFFPVGGEPQTPVAGYRLLPPLDHVTGPRHRGLSGDASFDLSAVEPLLGSTVEASHAFVAPEHRGTPAVGLLWSGISRYLLKAGSRYLLGALTIPVGDGGGQAALFYDMARARCWAPPRYECRPRRPFLVADVPRATRLRLPPLLHGYLQLGATVCSAPAHTDSGTADFLILLDLQHTDPQHLRRLLRDV